MRISRSVILFVTLLLVARAPSQTSVDTIRQQLATLIKQVEQPTDVGLVVRDANTGETIFAHLPDKPLKPASVLKLFISTAALERFGPAFVYKTPFMLHDGELWILGSGDPALGDERLDKQHGRPIHHVFQQVADALKKRGVTSIERIVLDDSIFEPAGRHQDWPDDQAQKWYQASPGGINFNDNCLDSRFVITDGRVVLRLQPLLPESFITNALKLGEEHKPTIVRDATSNAFHFSGPVMRDGELPPLSVYSPTEFFGHALKYALAQRGIETRGPVVRRRLERAATTIYTHNTELPEILRRINTNSQNLFGECVLKSLEAYLPDGSRSGNAGTWTGGAKIARTTLETLGIDMAGAILRDGSGLSHSNRVTAAQVANLLLRMKNRPAFYASLARAGESGSMKTGFERFRGRIRGKTGTISGVRSLAGYATDPEGRTYVFALLINGKPEERYLHSVCDTLTGIRQTAP